MKNVRAGSFVRPDGNGGFCVDWRHLSAESILATSRLLAEICARRQFASGRLLDVGCGSRPYDIVFEGLVERHVGVDYPSRMHTAGQPDMYAGALALPFRSESFDFVLCTEVIEHVPDPFVAMGELARVLKHGGRAIVTTPFMYRVHGAPYDFFRYTPFAYREMASRAGLILEELAPRGGYFTVGFDYLMKGLAMVVGGVNTIVRKIFGTKRHLIESRWVRFLFFMIQRPLIALLRRESVKSETYTLGYVAILRKA
ncbi:MAG: class I SAM-dependent methyltransferase [Candidatus Sumerlaeaceae bacterium]|nr:class I SAM-dependent methyltransferase [Candidatus Sumerlaeaceae bacterium]